MFFFISVLGDTPRGVRLRLVTEMSMSTLHFLNAKGVFEGLRSLVKG